MDLTSAVMRLIRKLTLMLTLTFRSVIHPKGGGGGGRGTPLYKPYRYVPPHRVGSLRRFGLKTVIHALCLFWSGIRHGFRGNCGVDELIYRFHFK